MTNEENEAKNNLEQAHLNFISTVSHELRTPLTSIRGFADTLLTSNDRLTAEQREKFLLIIKEQSNRLINLVENLLTASKVKLGEEVLVFKSVNPYSYVDSCVKMIKQQYKTHEYKIVADKNLPQILVDTDKFQQIIINLLDNASKYSDENTHVTITIHQDLNENVLRISIKDEGIGIEEKDIETVFNRFSRVDSPLTRKIQGNGLGLYITKNLTEKMRGKISVESSKQGSVFTISFPIANVEDTCKEKLKE